LSLRSERCQRAIVERAPQDPVMAKAPLAVDRHPGEANRDPLTKVFYRAHFDARLSEAFEEAKRSGNDFVLIFFDIDEFKVLNHVHGHRGGDEALVLVARVLSSNSCQADVVARYANDEFVVLMSATSLVDARRFFERVRKEVAERSAGALGFTLHLSARAVELLHAASAPRHFLEVTDHAMCVAEHQGSDHFFAAVVVGFAEDGREEHQEA